MSVTLFFRDGRIAEFPLATTADKQDHLIHLLEVHHDTLSGSRTFKASDVAIAHVYEFGTLTKVIIPGKMD